MSFSSWGKQLDQNLLKVPKKPGMYIFHNVGSQKWIVFIDREKNTVKRGKVGRKGRNKDDFFLYGESNHKKVCYACCDFNYYTRQLSTRFYFTTIISVIMESME